MDLGEDNWFEEYEKIVNMDLIEEIASVSIRVNKSMVDMYNYDQMAREEKNPVALELLRLEVEKEKRNIELWQPRLEDMRRNATYYSCC